MRSPTTHLAYTHTSTHTRIHRHLPVVPPSCSLLECVVWPDLLASRKTPQKERRRSLRRRPREIHVCAAHTQPCVCLSTRTPTQPPILDVASCRWYLPSPPLPSLILRNIRSLALCSRVCAGRTHDIRVCVRAGREHITHMHARLSVKTLGVLASLRLTFVLLFCPSPSPPRYFLGV